MFFKKIAAAALQKAASTEIEIVLPMSHGKVVELLINVYKGVT